MVEQALRYWEGLSSARRLGALGALGVALVVLLGSAQLLTAPDFAVAYAGLRDEDAAVLVAKLKERKIPYELGEGGTIRVPRSQVQEVRLLGSTQGVGQKGGGGVGLEMFTQPHFGLTEFAEKVNYQRALEGELARTISRLDAVETARVHLVMPQPTLFTASQREATASVILQLKAGRRLDSMQLQGITQLISSSVEGLKSQNVSVMDTAGNLLSDRVAASDPSRQTDRRADLQRAIEARLEDDVSAMLTRVLGPGRAMVRVGADLDWDQYEANTETFSPPNRPPQIRSQREITELSGSRPPGGVPGADSSVPTYASVGDGRAGSQSERHEVNTSYELSRTIEKTTRSPGAIRRLSVAVALDSEALASPEQVDALSRLVATAAGLDVARGDVVTLTAMPFAINSESLPAVSAEAVRQVELLMGAGRLLAMVVAPLLILLGIRMLLPQRRGTVALAEAATRPSLPAGSGPPQLSRPGTAAGGVPSQELEQARIEQELADFARREPAAVANIIRTWLREDQGVA